MKTAISLCLLTLLAVIAACSSAATSTTLPATEHPPPTATPTELLPAETRQQPAATLVPTHIPTLTPTPWPTRLPTPTAPPTATPLPTPTLEWPPPAVTPSSSLEELRELFSGLPSEAIAIAFVDTRKLPHGDSLGWYIDDDLSLLSKRTHRVLSVEMLLSAEIKRAAFGITEDYGAAILHGNFSPFIELLRQAPQLSDEMRDFGPPTILDPYREIEVFLFPYYDDLYLAIPDPGTMLLAQEAALIEEIIDRYLDDADLEESLTGLLDAIGPMDFLVAWHWNRAAMGAPEALLFGGGGGWFDGDSLITVFEYRWYDEPANAEQAIERMRNYPLVQGYNTGKDYPIREITQEGQAVIAKGYADTFDLAGWLLGN